MFRSPYLKVCFYSLFHFLKNCLFSFIFFLYVFKILFFFLSFTFNGQKIGSSDKFPFITLLPPKHYNSQVFSMKILCCNLLKSLISSLNF